MTLVKHEVRPGRSVALLLLAALCLAGCARKAPEGAGAGNQVRIGMTPSLAGGAYSDAAQRGAQEAADELGVELIYDAPAQARGDDQQQTIENWTARGVDVVAVAPNDPEAISQTLQDAARAGAVVLTWDSDANPQKSSRKIFVNQASRKAVAEQLVDIMVEGVGTRHDSLAGEYLIVSGTPTAADQQVCIELMKARIAEKYPQMTLLPPLAAGEDSGAASAQTAEAIALHPQLKGVWGLTPLALPAAAKAVRDAGRSNQIYVTGLSLPSRMEQYVQDGTVDRFVFWNPVDLGYLTVHVARRLHDGTLAQGVFDIGRLKNVEITSDEVILGPPLVFDKSNIGGYNF